MGPNQTVSLSNQQKLAVARGFAVSKRPYLADALMSLITRERPNLGADTGVAPTIAVTARGVMYWDPEAVAAWTVKKLAEAMTHEVLHLLRVHHARGRAAGHDQTLSNIAADLEINDDLDVTALSDGDTAPGGYLLPKMFKFDDGLVMEAYYQLLQQAAPAHQCNGVGSGACGSVAGKAIPGEDPSEGRSDSEWVRIIRSTAEAIRNTTAGKIPASWRRWADQQIGAAKIPWRQELARYVKAGMSSAAGAADYTYRRTSRRQAGMGWGPGVPVLPALRSPKPEVVVAVDTSGSMSDELLTAAMSEVRGVVAAAGGQVTFMACDAEIHAVKRVSSWQQAAASLKGGGGTNFNPIFDALQRREPDVCVVITDGYGPAPNIPPRYSVIWALIGGNTERPAKWGKCVVVAD